MKRELSIIIFMIYYLFDRQLRRAGCIHMGSAKIIDDRVYIYSVRFAIMFLIFSIILC